MYLQALQSGKILLVEVYNNICNKKLDIKSIENMLEFTDY